MAVKYHIGTSGWHYDHWRGDFYPQALPKTKWLEFYAQTFSTVELNNSFYHLPSENAFDNWRQGTPPGFIFAIKVSRLITHLKKLRNVATALDNFIARSELLEEKLGPLLYQIPPNMHRNDDVLEAFLASLQRGRQHVFEFRHQSWLEPEVFRLLSRHNAALCVFNMPELSCPVEATTDFAYIRFHGSRSLYSSEYTDQELEDWAQRIKKLPRTVNTVYIYFNNDAGAFAIKNALALKQKLA